MSLCLTLDRYPGGLELHRKACRELMFNLCRGRIGKKGGDRYDACRGIPAGFGGGRLAGKNGGASNTALMEIPLLFGDRAASASHF